MNSVTSTTRPPPKALLYCPDCWHAAPTTGDWLHRRVDAGEAVVCPDCDAVLTVRRGAGPVTA